MRQKQKYKPNLVMSIHEFGKLFPNSDAVLSYLERKYWKFGAFCPRCKSAEAARLPSKRGFWHCRVCRRQFNVRTGTIFQSSKISLYNWFYAFYFMTAGRKGISAKQLHRQLGISYKSAWLLEHKVREAMSCGKYDRLLEGIVECDETYVGGLEKNKHSDKRLHQGGGTAGKSPVWGGVERVEGGRTISIAVSDTQKSTLQMQIHTNVKKGSIVCTDEAEGYKGMRGYPHFTVRHKEKQWKDGIASTNKMESVWATLKRFIKGTLHKISAKHLQRCVDENDFRYNEGNLGNSTMAVIDKLVDYSRSRRLTHEELVGKRQE